MCRNEALQEDADTRERSGSVWTNVSVLPEVQPCRRRSARARVPESPSACAQCTRATVREANRQRQVVRRQAAGQVESLRTRYLRRSTPYGLYRYPPRLRAA
jgi:hypothetical protein